MCRWVLKVTLLFVRKNGCAHAFMKTEQRFHVTSPTTEHYLETAVVYGVVPPGWRFSPTPIAFSDWHQCFVDFSPGESSVDSNKTALLLLHFYFPPGISPRGAGVAPFFFADYVGHREHYMHDERQI